MEISWVVGMENNALQDIFAFTNWNLHGSHGNFDWNYPDLEKRGNVFEI